ncbi:hypothetical protein [Cohnella lupini]|uniref:Uncharacterized protein n=1 Tax=Cohnella lupini TaxID=1294267 RepID=A0A3D9IX16_9BACL|nr:hypothetical protein [Cohnella lupini]RED65656.1 hypothetical protein DFP95_101144 [Cohnella lupini]
MRNSIEEKTLSKAKLPQLYALQLERILARGLASSEIIELLRTSNEAELAERVDSEVKWERLLEYAKDNWPVMESAVLDGYSFPFITIGGIKSLLAIKFLKLEGTDYRITDDRLEGLRLTEADYNVLRSMIPPYWKFIRDDTAALPSGEVEITISF